MKRAFPLSLAAAALLAALAGCGQTPPASPAGASSGGPASSWSQDGGARSDASAAPSGGQTAAPRTTPRPLPADRGRRAVSENRMLWPSP